MGKSLRLPAAIANILLLAGLAAIWMAFAPLKLGGEVSYVMVNGISMEPGFHTGDLAIMRQAAAYQVGDIVAYTDAQMNANVIHRIIGTEENRFVLQGDNNSWIDAFQPTPDEVVGKLWLHLPQLAVAIEWVRAPLNMALAAGLIGGFFMITLLPQKPNKHGKKKPAAGGSSAGMFEMALYVCGFLALVCAGLAIFAFTRPATRSADPIKYQQTGVFFYTAGGAPGVYDGDAVRSGEPVFTKLTCTLNLGFTYILESAVPAFIAGSQQMDAVLLDEASGWKRTLPLLEETFFSGNLFTSEATLDLCAVQALVADVEKKTGFRPSAGTLVITARVAAAGKIAGQTFGEPFAPKLTLKFDSQRFYMGGAAAKTDPLKTVQPGTLPNPAVLDASVALLGLNLMVGSLRTLAVVGLVLSLLGLLALGLLFYAATRYDQEAVIRTKYSAMLLEVYDHGLELVSPVIDVASMEDLARLAERQNGMIIHLPREHAGYYFVQLEGTTFRFVTGKGGAVTSRLDRFWLWLSQHAKGAL